MHSWSLSSISSVHTFLQWAASLFSAGAVLATIFLILVRGEIGRRQNLQISELKLATARANEKAEAERLARTKLEASILPRVFVSTGETRDELGLFAGTNVVVEYETTILEAKRFAEQLKFTLGMSNWNVVLWSTQSHLPPGIRIFTKRQSDASLQQRSDDAATILSYQLIDAEIDTRLDIQGNPLPPSSRFDHEKHAIFVRIGEKPQPYLDAIKQERIYGRMDPATANALQEAQRHTEQTLARVNALTTPYERADKERIIQKYRQTPTAEPDH